MNAVTVITEEMVTAAHGVAAIGSDLSAAHTAAAAPTVGLVPAAADEVSAAIARLFSQHAASYQAMAGQAASFNDQFVQHLTAGASSYTNIEADIVALLESLAGDNSFISGVLAGVLPIAEQDPLEFALGTLLFLVGLPVVIVAAPFFILFLLALGVLS